MDKTTKKPDPTVIDRNPDNLYPLWKEMIMPAIDLCHKEGLKIFLFEGYRSYERSDYLFAQGRTRPGNIVTNARGGFSNHNFGLAVDLVFDGDDRDGIQWTWNGNYAKAAKIIKASNKLIEWAGDWKSFKETPHFQLKQPLKNAQLDSLYHAGGLPLVWAELDKLLKKK